MAIYGALDGKISVGGVNFFGIRIVINMDTQVNVLHLTASFPESIKVVTSEDRISRNEDPVS